MAALTLIAGAALLAGTSTSALGGDAATATPPGASPAPAASPCTVWLNLAIDGLGAGGCDVEVKPGHAGCQFKTSNPHHVTSGGQASVALTEVRSTSADRDCVFAITVREPGLEPRTFHRGLRLARPTAENPSPVQSLACYLRSPSKLARANDGRTTK